MEDLLRYIEEIVEPTVDEFKRNPMSERHLFLACVVIYHAIDRAVHKKGEIGNLKKEWRKKSLYFTIIDMIAHHFKHVKSDDERFVPAKGAIALSSIVFRKSRTSPPGAQMDMHNLYYVVRDAVTFLRQQLET